jgi:hypothetical protein
VRGYGPVKRAAIEALRRDLPGRIEAFRQRRPAYAAAAE